MGGPPVCGLLQKHIPSDWYATLSVTFAMSGLTTDQLKGRIEGAGLLIKSIRLSYELERRRKTVVCEVKLKRSDVSTRLLAELTKCDGIVRVR